MSPDFLCQVAMQYTEMKCTKLTSITSSFQISMNATPTMVAVVTSVPTHPGRSCVAADQDMNLLQMPAIVSVRIIASYTWFSHFTVTILNLVSEMPLKDVV